MRESESDHRLVELEIRTKSGQSHLFSGEQAVTLNETLTRLMPPKWETMTSE